MAAGFSGQGNPEQAASGRAARQPAQPSLSSSRTALRLSPAARCARAQHLRTDRRRKPFCLNMPRDPDSSRPAGPAVLSPSHSLGLEQPIARRDFLNAALLASGDLLLSGRAPHLLTRDWTGPGGVGDYRRSNGNTEAVMNAGHLIRDEVYARLPASAEDTGEIYDLAVIGGGISGLAAALFLDQAAGGKKSCLVLDNHPIFGGEAKRNEFLVDGRRLLAHQGSAVYFTPFPYSTLARFYRAIGLDPLRLAYQRWAGPEPEIPL